MTLFRIFSEHSKFKPRVLALGSSLKLIQIQFRRNLSHLSPLASGKSPAGHGTGAKPRNLANGYSKKSSISPDARHFFYSSFSNHVLARCCLVGTRKVVYSDAQTWAEQCRGFSRKTYLSNVSARGNKRFRVENSEEDEESQVEEDDERSNGGNDIVFRKPVEAQRSNSRSGWLKPAVDNPGLDENVTPAAVSDPRRDKRSIGFKEPVDDQNRVKKSLPVNYESAALRRELYDEEYEEWGRKAKKRTKISSIPVMIGEAIYGISPVFCALSAHKRVFYILYVQEGFDFSVRSKKKSKKTIARIVKMCDTLGLKRQTISKHDLNMMVDSRPHQGLILDAAPLDLCSLLEMDPPEWHQEEGVLPPVWVALDSITDPQNMGAVMRSSYFFGAAGVVVTQKNSSPLSGVVSKASAGAMESIELRSCRFMVQFLSNSSKNGWRILGGSVSSNRNLLNEVSIGVPTIFVLGNEGTGLDSMVEMVCDQLVTIPFQGFSLTPNPVMDVESLNVSVAAGIVLYHLLGNPQGWVLGDEHPLGERKNVGDGIGNLLEDGGEC